jgi:hypothetical protein
MADGDDGLSEQDLATEMTDAARRLANEVAARSRAHLNEVAEAVFLTHAGQPIAEVLIVLWTRANTNAHNVSVEDLADAANAISQGRRFAFV